METKYIIEGNIDFYNEINNKKESYLNNNYDDACLITNEPLTDKFVTMECGHKFNYIPLYNDLFKQKYFTNVMEEVKLQVNQIRCPYCRKVTNNLIPFYENFCILNDVYVRKIIGVNYYKLGEMLNYLQEKTLWEIEKQKVNKYKKKQFQMEVKENKLKVKEKLKEDKLKAKENKLKAKEKLKEDKLKAKEDKLKAKENKLKAKEKLKEDKLKAKEDKLIANEKIKEDKLKAKEDKLKAKEDK